MAKSLIESEFPIIEYAGADSVLQGLEAHTDLAVTSQLFVELGLDYVRGQLKDTDEPLPRIPPLRFRGGVRYQSGGFQTGGEVVVAAKQDRVFSTETETDGYQLLRLFAAYTFGPGGCLSHDHRATGQRDERAVPESPVAHQGPGPGNGTQFQAAVQRGVLKEARLRDARRCSFAARQAYNSLVPRDTLIDFFHDLAAARGDFLVYDDGFRSRTFTYLDVARAARGFAARLHDAGIRKGDKVIFFSENRPEWIVSLWGCLLQGIIVVPIDYRSSTDFLARVSRIVSAKLILTGRRFRR